MAKDTISGLPQAPTPLQANDLIVTSRNGTQANRATFQDLGNYINDAYIQALLAEIERLEGLLNGPVLFAKNTLTENITIPAGMNGLSISPTVSPGVTVTVPPGSVYAIV